MVDIYEDQTGGVRVSDSEAFKHLVMVKKDHV